MEHTPVLKEQVVEIFNQVEDTIIDVTIGGGGQSAAILAAKSKIKNQKSKIFGIDQDYSALEFAAENLKAYEDQITLVHGNFRNIRKILKELNIGKVNGILADLGMSRMQIDDPERGFSFRSEAPLDMNMNQSQKSKLQLKTQYSKSQIHILKSKILNLKSELSAWQIIHSWNESKIADILWEYGEERFARK